MQEKTCKTCKETKPITDYHTSNRCADGYRGVCKVCNGKANRVRYEKNYKGGMGHNQGRVPMPSQELLKSLFDLIDGKLVRKVSAGNCKAGSVVGKLRKDGYRRVWVDGAHALVHRLVWKMETGSEPPEYLDHINGDRDDNRIENLREATHSENMHNQEIRKSNTSGFTGIRWYDYPYTGKQPCWHVAITVGRKVVSVGYFRDIAKAIMAYERAAIDNHGDFAERKIAHNRDMAERLGIQLA